MIQPAALIHRVAGQVDAQASENVFIHLRQNHGGVHLAALELWQLRQRQRGLFAGSRGDGQGDQHLIGVQARVSSCPGS